MNFEFLNMLDVLGYPSRPCPFIVFSPRGYYVSTASTAFQPVLSYFSESSENVLGVNQPLVLDRHIMGCVMHMKSYIWYSK